MAFRVITPYQDSNMLGEKHTIFDVLILYATCLVYKHLGYKEVVLIKIYNITSISYAVYSLHIRKEGAN